MKLWHIGMAAPDLEAAQDAVGRLWGLDWRPVLTRSLTLAGADGERYDVDCQVTFSVGGPFAVELWESIPGTPLETPASGWLHHVGYWVDDLASEGDRLEELGHAPVMTREGLPLLNRGPGGLLVEPCDLHRDQPHLRDLFPPESPYFGAPVLPQGGRR